MSKEAMKLALDALVYASSYCDTYEAITVLREALAEQPAQQEPVAIARDGLAAIAQIILDSNSEDENQAQREQWAVDQIQTALAPQPAQHPKAKAIAECLAVLRPSVKGKFPHEQALEELVGYIAAPQPAQPQQEPVEVQMRVGKSYWARVDRKTPAEQLAKAQKLMQDNPGVYEMRVLYTPPQPAQQQEPVAWIEHEWSGTGLRHLHFEKREPAVRDEVVNPVWTPLYTTPPAQRKPLPDGFLECVTEAAAILSEIDPDRAPMNMRWPLADELDGFVIMIKEQHNKEKNT